MGQRHVKKRVIGLDVARALALFGMILINFKLVLGQEGTGWLVAVCRLFDGKAASTFVVLAGVGMSLMLKPALGKKNVQRMKEKRRTLVKRAIFLFVAGLSFYALWPADILHFYGIYMLTGLMFISLETRTIWMAAITLVALFPVLGNFVDYDTGWNYLLLEYTDFWTPAGFTRNLFFNGFHPVIPWAAFFLVGMGVGRLDLQQPAIVKKAAFTSFFIFSVVQLLSAGLIYFFSGGEKEAARALTELFGTGPMPPLPIYMLSGGSAAVLIISVSILIAARFENAWFIKSLARTGQLALTFYIAHVIVGMGLIEELFPQKMGNFSLAFTFTYAVAFSVSCLIFADIWKKRLPSGPMEWVMRKTTR